MFQVSRTKYYCSKYYWIFQWKSRPLIIPTGTLIWLSSNTVDISETESEFLETVTMFIFFILLGIICLNVHWFFFFLIFLWPGICNFLIASGTFWKLLSFSCYNQLVIWQFYIYCWLDFIDLLGEHLDRKQNRKCRKEPVYQNNVSEEVEIKSETNFF